jgi:predicted Zn finger-like uncharacterized protein
MAAIQPAVDRVRYLAGDTHIIQRTPTTITAKYNDIYSYGKCIAMQDGDSGWYVTNDRDSRTTNRHIKAAHIALGRDRIDCGYVPDPARPFGEKANWTYYMTRSKLEIGPAIERIKYLIERIDNNRSYEPCYQHGYQATDRVMHSNTAYLEMGLPFERIPVIMRGTYVVAWKDHNWWMVSPALYAVIEAFKIEHTHMGKRSMDNGLEWEMYADLNRYGKMGDSVMVGTVSDHDFVCDNCSHWFMPDKSDIRITDGIHSMLCPNCGHRLMIVDRKTVDLGRPFSDDEIAAMSQTIGAVITDDSKTIKLSGKFTDREDM